MGVTVGVVAPKPLMRPDLDSSRTRMVGVSNRMSVRVGLNASAYLKTCGPPLFYLRGGPHAVVLCAVAKA